MIEPVFLKKPETKVYDEEKETWNFTFAPGSMLPSGEWALKGGVAWPALMEDNTIQGYILMAGLHLKSNVIYIIAEREFVVIDHLIREADRGIAFAGLAPWFNDVWAAFGGYSYYWYQDDDTGRRYRSQVGNCLTIQPKPVFPKVEWKDVAQPMCQVYAFDTSGRLRYVKDHGVHAAMMDYNANKDEVPQALHALMCAITGLDRWRRR